MLLLVLAGGCNQSSCELEGEMGIQRDALYTMILSVNKFLIVVHNLSKAKIIDSHVTQFTHHHDYHPSLNQVYSCAGTHFSRVTSTWSS